MMLRNKPIYGIHSHLKPTCQAAAHLPVDLAKPWEHLKPGWSAKCGVWSGKCRVWSVECGVWSVECGV